MPGRPGRPAPPHSAPRKSFPRRVESLTPERGAESASEVEAPVEQVKAVSAAQPLDSSALSEKFDSDCGDGSKPKPKRVFVSKVTYSGASPKKEPTMEWGYISLSSDNEGGTHSPEQGSSSYRQFWSTQKNKRLSLKPSGGQRLVVASSSPSGGRSPMRASIDSLTTPPGATNGARKEAKQRRPPSVVDSSSEDEIVLEEPAQSSSVNVMSMTSLMEESGDKYNAPSSARQAPSANFASRYRRTVESYSKQSSSNVGFSAEAIRPATVDTAGVSGKAGNPRPGSARPDTRTRWWRNRKANAWCDSDSDTSSVSSSEPSVSFSSDDDSS